MNGDPITKAAALGGLPRRPRIYVMNDYDTVIAYSEEEAVEYYAALTGDRDSIEEPIVAIEPEALEKIMIRDCDDYDAPRISGKDHLEDWLKTGGRIPEVFTSTEC
jgi:hypothetical protein